MTAALVVVGVLAIASMAFTWVSCAEARSHADEIHNIEVERMQAEHRAEVERLERMLHVEDNRRFSDLNHERERVNDVLRVVMESNEQFGRLAMSRNAADFGALERMHRTPADDLGAAEKLRAEVVARRVPPPAAGLGGDEIVPHGAG